jgi:hypothetical protein
MAEGVAGVLKKRPPDEQVARDLDYLYHATQVVYFFGGNEWKDWNQGPAKPDESRTGGMRDRLMSSQHVKDDPDRGSWEADTGAVGKNFGRLGTTALSVLTLEVYYRYGSIRVPAAKFLPDPKP